MTQHLISKLVGELKNQQASLAESCMLRPRENSLDYGVMAGRYQGIQNALDTLDDIMRDHNEQESKS